MEMFDASVAVAHRLTQGLQPAGAHEVRWDGRDDDGNLLPAGVYLTRVETADGVTTGKVTLAR